MELIRPNPDLLLKQISSKKPDKSRGKLKIFLGYAAGIGKTYTMLDYAHMTKEEGIDVVAGYIEPHTRPETLALLEGLEVLPPLEVHYKNITLKEFDIDGAIRRNPQLILVDELAHSNAEGCRHRKRYQDIEELLKAGIDVYTTVNIQHLESLNDIVAGLTGIVVRERIPDSIFDSADQIELLDIDPDDLIERFHKGKIYKEKQAEKALGNFFTRENLVALRELALRRAADRVNKTSWESESYQNKSERFIKEHILCCVSTSASNAKIIRAAARMADAFHSSFTALYVETSDMKKLSGSELKNLRENMKLAEQLGAKVATVFGEDISYQIAAYAKASGVSKIVIGRSPRKKIFLFTKRNFIDKLTELTPNIDIYIIPNREKHSSNKYKSPFKAPKISFLDAGKVIGFLLLSTILGFWFFELGFSESNVIMVYILGVLFTALVTEGTFYSGVSSVLAVLTFNFLFTDPRFSFEAYDPGYPITFIIMFLASFLTSTVTNRMKRQSRQTALKASRTEVLLETSQKLQRVKDREGIIRESVRQMMRLLNKTVVFYPVREHCLEEPFFMASDDDHLESDWYLEADEYAVADWVYRNNKHAGATTDTLPGAKCLYLSVRSEDTVLAVVGIAISNGERLEAFEKNLLMAMLSECALALEKEHVMEIKNQISIEAKQEQLRSNLLRAISHDLRTPLTSISGNAGILMKHGEAMEALKKQDLYADIYDDSIWLINLVENLLSVTRIENGTMHIEMQPELLSEVIEEALLHLNREKSQHSIEVSLEEEFLMAYMDAHLIIQVIINIVDNAIKYTDPGSHICISAKSVDARVEVKISDNGNGIPQVAKEKLFEMFFTADNQQADGRRGLGLGLALCKSIIEAHDGTISAKDNEPKGTVICFTLQGKEMNFHE